MDNYSVAVDVGGTFTDVVLCNLDTNQQSVFKTPSTPDDPSAGFLTGLQQILEVNGVKPAQVKHIFHGTTIATNAILENKGSRVGVLVTEGFKYVLEIGRHGTPRLVNPNSWIKPERPVRPRDIEEIPERVGFDGEVLIPLDETAVRRAARRFRDEGISSIAVSFLHSYANRDHESRARELILEEFPNAQVSLSSEVLAVFREYERTITTVLNAYVMPRVSTYLGNLERALGGEKVDSTLSIMKSNGGIVGSSVAVRQPVHTALSGPAAGVMATLQIAESTGVLNCISFDMGGTSTDVSLIRAASDHQSWWEPGRLADPVADAGYSHDRMWRRKHRRSLSIRRTVRRPRQRRGRSGSGLLWQWWNGPHGDRRQPGAGPYQYPDRRRDTVTGLPGRSGSDTAEHRVTIRLGPKRRRQRDSQDCQQYDGWSNPEYQR